MSTSTVRRATLWHGTTALVVLIGLVWQVTLVAQGVNVLVAPDGRVPGAGTRLVRFFSYFTVQSNLLVLAATTLLALNPVRDGRVFRLVRLTALYGIAVTFVIYLTLLLPILDLHGASFWTDKLLHVASPLLALIGWFLFGPRPRIDLATVGWSLVWPALYVTYTLVHGLDSWRWYPYPFVDVNALGYLQVVINGLGILVLLVLLALGLRWLDSKLRPAPVPGRRPG